MLEDDVFFAELSKRISLLITDDDEGAADFAAAAQFIPAAAAAAPLTVSPCSSSHHQARACTCGNSSGSVQVQTPAARAS